MKPDWNRILMYACFIYSGIAFEFVYIQLIPLLNNSANYALPPPPFVYDAVYKTTPSYVYYIIIVSFLGSVMTLLAGISIYNTIKAKEREAVDENWIENVTDENEKHIISILRNSSGKSTQSRLVKESGLTKVRVHRIVQRLESNNIIRKSKYGQTNMIRLCWP